jgi:putative addiction module killer protein
MVTVRQTLVFANWLVGLRDQRARERIAQRIVRLEAGLFGDAKSIGPGALELRIDYGPGYRLYFMRCGNELVILLCGGAKSTQKQDILIAKRMVKELKDEER